MFVDVVYVDVVNRSVWSVCLGNQFRVGNQRAVDGNIFW